MGTLERSVQNERAFGFAGAGSSSLTFAVENPGPDFKGGTSEDGVVCMLAYCAVPAGLRFDHCGLRLRRGR